MNVSASVCHRQGFFSNKGMRVLHCDLGIASPSLERI